VQIASIVQIASFMCFISTLLNQFLITYSWKRLTKPGREHNWWACLNYMYVYIGKCTYVYISGKIPTQVVDVAFLSPWLCVSQPHLWRLHIY
jgi:uncharacterized membrane protein